MEGEIPIDKNDKNEEKEKEKLLRKQHKEAVKVQKQEKRLKREGNTPSDVGRKLCDLCTKEVDMLIRCTIDETQKYNMVCGKCWPSISGGVVDGDSKSYPYYRYGGVWKNHHASIKKKIGNGKK